MRNESVWNVLLVIVLLCLVCSVVVASTAVLMRPHYEANKADDISRNILQVAGLYREGADMQDMLRKVDARFLDLRSQSLLRDLPSDADGETKRELTRDEDIAGIRSIEEVVKVFLVYDNERLQQIIFPVSGYGLWSTLRGFLSVQADGATVRGLQFYEHKETPGLGGEVDRPAWRKLWSGKRLFDEENVLRLRVVKGRVRDDDANAQHQVDGLAGATLTSRGVSNMLRFWFGDEFYGGFLKKLREMCPNGDMQCIEEGTG